MLCTVFTIIHVFQHWGRGEQTLEPIPQDTKVLLHEVVSELVINSSDQVVQTQRYGFLYLVNTSHI